MVKTKLSDLGSSVCGDKQKERFIPALGNGSCIPGDLCYIVPGTGRVAGADKTTAAFFQGILMESILTGTETAIVADIPCKLVVPKSGHEYNIRITAVAAAADKAGSGVIFHDDAGKGETTMAGSTLALSKIGRLVYDCEVLDTVAKIEWIE